jgi:hypothetical protein
MLTLYIYTVTVIVLVVKTRCGSKGTSSFGKFYQFQEVLAPCGPQIPDILSGILLPTLLCQSGTLYHDPYSSWGADKDQYLLQIPDILSGILLPTLLCQSGTLYHDPYSSWGLTRINTFWKSLHNAEGAHTSCLSLQNILKILQLIDFCICILLALQTEYQSITQTFIIDLLVSTGRKRFIREPNLMQ